jgi:hypothetical protein
VTAGASVLPPAPAGGGITSCKECKAGNVVVRTCSHSLVVLVLRRRWNLSSRCQNNGLLRAAEVNLAGEERTSWATSAGIGPDRRGGRGSAMQDISDLRGRWNAEGVLRPNREGAAA